MERQIAVQKNAVQANRVQQQLPASHAAAHPMLELQRSIGNAATRRLLGAPYLQAKLQVSNPEDPLEREADQTADAVMRMPEPGDQTRTNAHPIANQVTRLVQRDTQEPEEDEEEKVVAAKSTSGIPLAVREEETEEEVPVQRACAECEDEMNAQRPTDEPEHEQVVSRKDGGARVGGTSPHARSAVSHAAARNIHALKGGGSPLPAASRAFFEARFGADLSHVRVHTDSRANDTAKSINAKAFTVGRNIAFSAGQYEPQSHGGQRLLAHELTHVAQQNGDAVRRARVMGPAGSTGHHASNTQSTVWRDPNPPETATPPSTQAPAPTSMTVSMSGMSFRPGAGATFKAGRKLSQGVAMVLMRLLSDQYQPGLEDELLNHLQQSVPGFGISGLEGNATEGEPLGPVAVDVLVSAVLVGWARSRNLNVALSDAQKELLYLGMFAARAWFGLHDTATQDEVGVDLPEWYTRFVFTQELGRRAGLLRAYAQASTTYMADRSEENRIHVVRALDAIVQAILPGVLVVEKIEHDTALRDHEGYVALFGGPVAPAAGQPTTAAPATPSAAGQTATPPDADIHAAPGAMEKFLTFLHSQPDLMERVDSKYKSAEGRVLLDRFARYLKRTAATAGDQVLRDQPGGANEQPHPATLSSFPALTPPLFDAALGTDHTFVMTLLFPTVFDAFANYYFDWDRVRVPDAAIGGNVDLATLEGDEPTFSEVAAARFGRAGRYLEADMERAIDGMVSRLGVGPGVYAPSLSLANGVLRFLGTGIRLGFEYFTMPRYEKKIVFPGEGLYLVRCKAIPIHGDDAEIVRAPSVAYLPVFARHPLEMAQIRVQGAVSDRRQSMDRLLELQTLLSEPVSHMNQETLQEEYNALSAALGSAAAVLEYQKQELQKRLAQGGPDPERGLIEKRLEELEIMIEHRRERAGEQPLERAERLAATFVSDEGQIMHLLIEAVELEKRGRYHQVYISDVTTRKSGQETALGASKSAAIQTALQTLLEGPSGYGRGFCSVSIDGSMVNLRIEASEGMMLMEAFENLSTIASIAAVVAAPLTGGASLSLLLPIGLVGAIPSAYRIASRAEAGTLHMDLELAMDLVNIVGGVAGGAQAATRSLRIGSALMVLGIGADGLGVMLMGAGIMQQIEALEGLPAGLRAARIMEIMGNAMLNAGISIGGALAARRHQIEADIAASDPRTREWVSVRSEGRITIGGQPHQVSVGVIEGRLVIRICSDCRTLLRALGRTLQDPIVNDVPGLRRKLEDLNAKLTELDAAITENRIPPGEAQIRIEELTARLNELAQQHPQPISSIVGPETPRQHERRNILEDMQRTGEATPHSFTLTEGIRRGDPPNRFSRIARELRQHIDEIVASGARNPVPGFNDGVLDMKAMTIVMSDTHLSGLYTEIYRAVVEGHRPTLALPQYRHLTRQTRNRMRRALEKFDSLVKNTRPDVVDFDLLRGRIDVSDITFDAANPMHNLKTLYYAEVMRRMTGMQVTATEVTGRTGALPVLTPL